MGKYLEATSGRCANSTKTEWEKAIAARMICTNNGAESSFATVRAFLHMYSRYFIHFFCINVFASLLFASILLPNCHPILFSFTQHLPLSYSLKLQTVASMSEAIVNGTHRPVHKVGRRMVDVNVMS
jgi:hypothetical protein